MASLTGQLVAETYKALLKLIDNDILTASEKQITDGFGGGSNVFIDSQGFLRANKYKITNGLATQFLKADGSLDSNAYLTSITGAQVITALGYTPVPTTRTITINGETHNLAADNSWTVGGTAAIWGNIAGILSNQTDLQNALNAKVPYTGATANVDLGENALLAEYLSIDTATTHVTDVGEIVWNAIDGTFDMGLLNGVVLQAGQELHFYGKATGVISNGQAVMFAGVEGDHLLMSLADAATINANPQYFIGIATQDFANNDFGYVTVLGKVRNLDTTAYSLGAVLYYDSTNAIDGKLTTTMPIAPNAKIEVAAVVRVHATQGSLMVRPHIMPKLNQIQDVYIADPANNHGLFYDLAGGYWKNTSIASALGYTPQAQLNGTGFVKILGTTISYDNSTYLSASDAASTYQRLDKMVSNLLPSSTEYPNSNAVINALALKADALNPVFTGYMTILGAEPKLYFTDTDQNPDYFIGADAGFFRIYDQTAGATRFVINSSGVTTIAGDLIVGTIAKSGGTASQFLKADGSIDSNSYVTSASLANYLLISTAASTYQRLDKMVSNLLPSSTEYPNSNAVINALALKADAANPVFTGNMTISGATPRLYFVDTDQNPDYTVFIDSGYFYIYDQTAGATRFSINSSGNINTGVGKSITAGSFIKESGTASQYLMADGSVSTFAGITGSGTTNYLPKWTSASGLGNSLIYDDGTNVGIGTTTMYGKLSVSSGNAQAIRVDSNSGYPSISIGGVGTFSMDSPGVAGGRFLIFDNGNTSIGSNTDSGFKLNVNGTGRFVGNLKLSSGGTLNIVPTSYGSNGFVAFRNIADTATRWNVYNHTIGGTTYGSLQFSTGDGVDKLRIEENGAATFANSITGNGNIDINLTSPLFIANASSTTYFGGLSIRQSGTEKIRYAANSDVGGYIYSATWNGFSFLSDSATYIRINTNGNVGINTSTDAGYKFDVNGTGRFTSTLQANAKLFLQRAGAGADTLIQFKNEVGTDRAYINFNGTTEELAFYSGAGGTRNMVIGSDGAMGFNYPTLGVRSFMFRALSGRPLAIEVAESTGVHSLYFRPNSTARHLITSNYLSGGVYLPLSLSGRENDLDLVLNSGFVGLGVASPTGALHIYNSNPAFRIQNSVGGNMQFGQWDTVNNRIEGSGGLPMLITSYSQPIKLGIDGSESMRLSTDNQLIVGATSMTYTNSTQGYMAGFKGGITSQAYISIATSNHALASQGVIIGYDTSYARFHVRQNLGISFGTNDTSERVIITNTGNLLAGRTADSGERIQVTAGNATAIRIDTNANYNAINIGGYGNISVDYPGIGGGRFYLDGGGALTIRQSMTATSFFESSDFRKKKLIEHNPIVAGIENLQCKLYEKDGKIELGYFAQDAELIMPYAVTKNEDGFLNLSYREVHTAKIARLEQRVAELEKQLNVA